MRFAYPVFPAVGGIVRGLCANPLYFCEEEEKTEIKEIKEILTSASKIFCKVEEIDTRAIDTVFVDKM
jgi:hypothetical protein